MRKFNVPCVGDTLKCKVKNSEGGNGHLFTHFQHLLSKEAHSNSNSRDRLARYHIKKKYAQIIKGKKVKTNTVF
jgi:hypothetical protein